MDTFSSSMQSVVTECCSYSYIRTLVSIEYVLVKDIKSEDENPRKIHGAVMVEDWQGFHVLYDRSRDNTESKGPGDYISLTGPSTEIRGADAFIISVSLWDREYEIAKDEIVFDPRNEKRIYAYDKHLEEDLRGKHGSVSVGYSVISDALSATIDIVMINEDGDGESSTDVYGTIKASYLLGNSGSSTRILFDKHAQVSPNQSIPLTRPFFPVPEYSDLTIAVNLWNHDSLSPDHQITRGSVQFTPITGTQLKNITGEYGQVQVSITCV